jgi:methionine aminopeptidase
MEIELWSVVVVLVTGGYLAVRLLLRPNPSTPHLSPLPRTTITSNVPKYIANNLTERGFNSCITAYSIKHGYLPTEVLANYETILDMSSFMCRTDAGLVLATGDVVKIKLDVHSFTNDLTFKGNANDTDK